MSVSLRKPPARTWNAGSGKGVRLPEWLRGVQ